jgi:hypothetical protein
MSVDEKSIIKKVYDKKEPEKVVQIVIQDHERIVRADRGVRAECTVIGSTRVMVGAPCFWGSVIIFVLHTKAEEKKQQCEDRKDDPEKEWAEPLRHGERSVAKKGRLDLAGDAVPPGGLPGTRQDAGGTGHGVARTFRVCQRMPGEAT